MRLACVVVPHFLVEVERLRGPVLRGRPVVVGGAPEDRKEVLDCSPEAMAHGVHPGMPLREAFGRCASAVFVEANPERYRAVMQAMVEALLEVSSLVELAQPGVIYVGLGPPARPRTGCLLDPFEVEAGKTIELAAHRASGLPVRVGIADSKFAAYVAAVRGDTVVPSGEGAAFLEDLSVDDLPVSTEMQRRLRLLGLRRLGDLARLPQGAVAVEFGAEGARAWELAHGVDRSPLVAHRPPKSLTERLAFASPVEVSDTLIAAVRRLLERALRRPPMRGRAARGLSLRVHLEGEQVWERQVTFREPVGGADRMLLALRPKIESAIANGALGACSEVELILLQLCGERSIQLPLFPSRQEQSTSLVDQVAEAARQLKARYGRPMLARVMEVEPWSRIPERRFALIEYDP